ncbi:MAG TPA: response regulator [Burkholderiales bacterium]|jgi:DNA-binding NarL/FixJ family response regulator|nr:response regulator [Burkholderiales bacterium]
MSGDPMPLVAPSRENTVYQPVPTQTIGAPLQVLLVEDSPVIRESVVELIEGSGRARVAYSTDSEPVAINELKANPYDVVIVDLRLREGSGFGVLRALQQLQPDTLTIVLTNYTSTAIRKRCAELGVKWFFDKSSEFEGIVNLISDPERNTRS